MHYLFAIFSLNPSCCSCKPELIFIVYSNSILSYSFVSKFLRFTSSIYSYLSPRLITSISHYYLLQETYIFIKHFTYHKSCKSRKKLKLGLRFAKVFVVFNFVTARSLVVHNFCQLLMSSLHQNFKVLPKQLNSKVNNLTSCLSKCTCSLSITTCRVR